MKLSSELLKHAKMLVKLRGNGLEQVNLRRAISAAYYALFHAVCEVFAESVVGDGKELKRAWLQTYRSLNHKTVCNRLMDIHDFLKNDKKEKTIQTVEFPQVGQGYRLCFFYTEGQAGRSRLQSFVPKN